MLVEPAPVGKGRGRGRGRGTAPAKPKQVTKAQIESLEVALDSSRNPVTEDDVYFAMRSTYSREALNAFQGDISTQKAITLGYLAATKATYGVKYGEELEKDIAQVNAFIK